ncbi:MAG TPA: hypothetical protein VG942_04680 [Hyphomonadaceae bacterium]|nr:hypothetical protein [Hyphomonadaceae bacterium]
MQLRNWLVVLSAVALTACGLPMAPDEALLAQNDQVYADVVLGKNDAFFARLPKNFDTPQQRKMLAAVRQIIPDGKATAAQLTGWNAYSGTDGQREALVVRYDYGSDHVTVATTFNRPNSAQPWGLFSFNLSPTPPEFLNSPAIGGPRPAPPVRPADAAPPS